MQNLQPQPASCSYDSVSENLNLFFQDHENDDMSPITNELKSMFERSTQVDMNSILDRMQQIHNELEKLSNPRCSCAECYDYDN